eukprot:TRINITY_DN38994_c0_g1_i1.p1 TRINITY_DN38994_c0_g1~~TRINITY_DN38994_c0_g1_i1.p1  ORF type:complete len:476 (+),score=62.28 TRINITY_DN38994_c0_g1_i1:57-1484(+)
MTERQRSGELLQDAMGSQRAGSLGVTSCCWRGSHVRAGFSLRRWRAFALVAAAFLAIAATIRLGRSCVLAFLSSRPGHSAEADGLRLRGSGRGCGSTAASLHPARHRRSLALHGYQSFGFQPIPPPDHPDHPGPHVQPFAEQNGGVDEEGLPPPRVYSHGLCGSTLAYEFVVDGRGFHEAAPGSQERAEIVEKTLAVLRSNGFAIVEGMLPLDAQRALEADAVEHWNQMPAGFMTQPLRASRSQVHVPFAEPWSADWITMNDLVLQVTARYCINNMACGRTEEEQQAAWVQWVMQGSKLDWFRTVGPQPGELADNPPNGCTNVGSSDAVDMGPWLGRVMITKAPARTPLMRRHRDIILPGPGAQLTIMVPMTPLTANNGPLALRPRSHVMETPGYELVANIPPGAIMLYDSFTDHRAMENMSPHDRYALYYEFETRGIFTGYVQGHFGEAATECELDFRKYVDPTLRQYVAEAKG